MKERIKRIMASVLGIDPNDIDDNTSADSIDTWDSLGHINLILALEEEFDLTFDVEDVPNLINFRLIELAIEEKN